MLCCQAYQQSSLHGESYLSYGKIEYLVNYINFVLEFLERKMRKLLNEKISSWADVTAGVHERSIFYTLSFLIYINDVSDNLS